MRFAESLWLLGALGALLLGGLLALGAFFAERRVRRFGERALVVELMTARAGGRRALKAVLLVLSLALAFVALAQPQYGRGTRILPATNLDVVVVLDYSKSMHARDVAPSRIERAKAEVSRLIADLPGARFGAVAFAGEAIAFPLTSDGAAIAQFFRQLGPNDMPVGGTAIARALEAGRELLGRDPLAGEHRKVILLVTDGEDLEGDPVSVAQAAAQNDISIHVVQVGGRTPEPIPDVNEVGQVIGYRKDSAGRPLTTSLSAAGEEELTKIAESTGGLIVRAQKGETGIPAIADRLRQLMTEELSEKVETVYADVYAYPLVLALLLLLIETFVPEAPARGRPTLPPAPEAPQRARRRRAAGAAASGLAAAFVLAPLAWGCEQTDALFVREAPAVKEAVAALDAGDAGVAIALLEEYLSTGKCENGSIGTPDRVRERPNASFDLGLGLFQIAESFGKRFGDEPSSGDGGLSPTEQADLAKRSAEVDCALRIVRLAATDPGVPIDLRARAHYLAGNLEFLRGEYEPAIVSYDEALKLIPGLPEDAGDGIGRDAAYNRAIALRRIEEREKDAGSDGGEPPDAGSDAGEPDGGDQNEDGGSDQPDGGNEPPDGGNQEPDGGNQEQDAGGRDQDGGKPPQEQPDAGREPEREPSASQDDRLLDMLERAPTLQEHNAKQNAGRVRQTMEDK